MDTTSKGLSLNVKNDDTSIHLVVNQESSTVTRNAKKRRRSTPQNTDVQIQRRKMRKLDFENEETVLRDNLLDKIDSMGSRETFENQASIKEISMENLTGQKPAIVHNRKIIKLKGKLPNLALPEGWLALNHRSGGIIYLHRPSRVCTWSRPYYLGDGSVRKHDVPIAAIPCLHQKKALETESNLNKFENNTFDEQPASSSSICSSVSALNFINAAGASFVSDGQMELQHPETHLSKSYFGNQICIDGIGGGDGDGNGSNRSNSDGGCINGNVGNNDVKGTKKRYNDFLGGDGKKEACHVYCTSGNDGVSGKRDGVVSDIINDATEIGHRVWGDISKGCEDDVECSVSINSCHDGITDDCTASSHQSLRLDKHNEDAGIQTIVPNIILTHRDGLGVVNEVLTFKSSEISSLKHDKPSESEELLPSSKSSSKNIFRSALGETEQTNRCLRSKNSTPYPVRVTNVKINNSSNSVHDKREDEISNVHQVDKDQSVSLISSKSKKCSSFSASNRGQKPKSVSKITSSYHESGIELVDSEELYGYLEKLFQFEELSQEQEQNVAKTSLDQSTEQGESVLSNLLERVPYCVKGISAKQNKEWILNPGGKTPIAILHEYSQAVLKEKPVYVCSECENPSAPFMAEVQINDITHGTGVASSKKQAKQAAAEATLQVFLPDEFKKICDYQISPEELQHFDKLTIDNPNVYEVSIKSGLPSPSQLLQECLKRNQGVCSSVINFKIIPGENQNDHSYKISCGKHSAEGLCKNKKQGRQLASQALLKKLHPHVSTWGSLLRIYCDRPSTLVKKYKATEDDILMSNKQRLAGDAPRGELVLARLKLEMKKLADDKKQTGQSSPQRTKGNTICTVDI